MPGPEGSKLFTIVGSGFAVAQAAARKREYGGVFMQKPLLAALVVAATTVMSVSGGQAETTLGFATTDPPPAHLNVQVLYPWAERINDQGKGILKIDVRDGPAFANHGNYFERARSNVSQIGWSVPASLGSTFVKSTVASLSLAPGTIGGRTGLGGVTGSSLATTATIGRAALPEMLGRGDRS